MVEDRFESREFNIRQALPWTQLFRGFGVALDHKKMLLAAVGILGMAFGWWLLAAVSYSMRTAPDWRSGKFAKWEEFQEARGQWNLFYEAAGPDPETYDASDLANSVEEFEALDSARAELRKGKAPAEVRGAILQEHPKLDPKALTVILDGRIKPYGRLRTWPWFEDRGPNPYLLLTGKSGHVDTAGNTRYVPWNRGEFFDWFLSDEIPVLIEPLVKLLRPVLYLLHPHAGFLDRFYFLLVVAWTVVTWAIFGGAITRIATLEVARNDKIGFMEALRYTIKRWQSYVFASSLPLLGIAACVIVLMLFGILSLVPVLAEFWDGILWGVVLGIAFVMTIVVIGLVGWPMIHATLSAEGSDSYDALSRCYSYVLQRPWDYIWYAVVSLVYGAAVIFFVGFFGSLMVYLGKWGVSQTPLTDYFNRDPSYMFVYTPTSYGWRDLLLEGTPVVKKGDIVTQELIDEYKHDHFRAWNYVGAGLVTLWLWALFLLMIGFGYSYFWSASTIIYLLMRRKVDDTDLDEVYLEDEEEESFTAPVAPSAPQPVSSGTPLQMVEAPTLRSSAAPSEGESSKPSGGSVPTGSSPT
jgi:hypothetical protein